MGELVPAPRCSGVLPAPAVDPRFVYTAETHAKFDEEGFHVSPHFLTAPALQFIRERADEIIHNRVKEVHLEWIMSIHETLEEKENWVMELATHPALLAMLRFHLGEDIVLFSSQLAVKPPGKGRIVPWHQDGERCRTVWIPLDKVTPYGGGLRVQPGWHKLGRLPFKRVSTKAELARAEFFLKHHLFEITAPPGRALGQNVVSQRMPAGALEIHHPGLPHSSGPNRSRAWRRALLLRYQPLSEPLAGGTIVHWRDGSTFTKRNYLVCGGSAHAPPRSLPEAPVSHTSLSVAAGEREEDKRVPS
eukprot:m.92944 g.92944  ORF g.92944 m.92944 type:complete len:304 (-) comp13787_c0_seq4:20-931(-)